MGSVHEFQVTSKGWLIAAGGDFAGGTGFVGAWSIDDNGDVAPRWRIPVQQLTGYVPYSIVLDPVHQEMMMAAAGRSTRIRVMRCEIHNANTEGTFWRADRLSPDFRVRTANVSARCCRPRPKGVRRLP